VLETEPNETICLKQLAQANAGEAEALRYVDINVAKATDEDTSNGTSSVTSENGALIVREPYPAWTKRRIVVTLHAFKARPLIDRKAASHLTG